MLILNSVFPSVPAEEGFTQWPLVIMLFIVALALVALPLVMNWLFESEYERPMVRDIMKGAQIALLLLCLATVVLLPHKIVSSAETFGGAWKLFAVLCLIGGMSGLWFKQTEYFEYRAWYIALAFVAVCFISTFVYSLALALDTLISQLVAVPFAVVVIVVGFGLALANNQK